MQSTTSSSYCPRTHVWYVLMGTRAEGFKELSVMYVIQKTSIKARCYLMGDDTGPGSKVNPHTYIHTCSLLFAFLVAWELAKGPKASHQEGGER